MNTSKVIELPVFIDVHDVMRSMKCSRTMAYGHMRAALGRAPGERGQLRVPLYVWHRYVQARFDRERAPTPARQSGSSAQRAPTSAPIALTRPRTKPRTQTRATSRLTGPSDLRREGVSPSVGPSGDR
jgi:hypothetical protein